MASSLDDLLKSIRDEAKKESALVVMDGKSDDRLVDEEIDERVLRLLGIEDVFDIDYATYKTLLKERMMAARMSGSKIPTEEAEVITDEFKRVKGKEGRFKVKKKKISVGDIRKTSPLKNIGSATEAPQKLLAPAKELSPIEEIIKSLGNIVSLLQERNSLLKKQSNRARKESQNKKRATTESRFEESGLGKVLKGAKKVIAPVQNILSKIFETFMKVIVGRFIIKFIDWFSDPQNQGKINAIGKFLEDHWPKLLAAYLLFGNSLGRFVVRITATLIRGSITLLTKVLPNLLKFVAANPKLALLAGAAGLFAAGAVVPAMFPETVKDDADKQADAAAKEKGNKQAAEDIRNQKGNPVLDFLTGAGQERKEQAQRLETGEEKRYGFFGELNEGGRVSGPSGTDVIPARLTDGEFVMSKGAVDTFGTDFMEGINAAGGGNNRPKNVSGTLYASGGGKVGSSDEPKSRPSLPEMGYRLGQINPETFVTSITRIVEETIEKTDRRRGQGGRFLGDTTRRDGSGFSVSESADGFTTTQIDRMVRGGRLFQDKTTLTEITAAIGRPDLIEHQDQILKQLPKGTTIQDVMGGVIPGVTTEQLARILATSDAQKATNLKETRARRLDEAIRGIDPNDPTAGYSMSAGDMTPAMIQGEATANKRHAELMKSTNPEKIAAYDKQHGEGAYSQKLKEKLYRIYGKQSQGQTQPTATGQVVGRENLSPQAQAAIARLESKKGLPPDMQYTRNGKKISAGQFDMIKGLMGAARAGGVKGVLNHVISGAKSRFGGMFDMVQGAINDPKSFVESMGGTVKDGNIGTPTAQEQKDFDALAAKKEQLRLSEARLAKMTGSKVSAPQPPTPSPPKVMTMNTSSSGSDSQPSSPQSNSLPQWSASSNSTSKGRTTKLFGIF